MVFTYGLSPVIVQLGPFALRWYALVYVAGFLLAYWLLVRFAKQGRIEGLDAAKAEDFMVWLIVGTLVGARFVYALVYNPFYYLAEPWKILFLWEGGMSFHGGLIGAVLAGLWWTRRRKVRFSALADLLMLPLSLMLVFGRLANFVNGELPGRIADATRVPWCITYPQNPAIPGCRHPSQFYEAGKNLLIFLALLPLYAYDTVRKRLREGTIFWLFVLLYGVGRFITDFWRAPDPTDFTLAATGLLVGQWLSLLMAAVGVAGLAWLYWPKKLKTGRKKGNGKRR